MSKVHPGAMTICEASLLMKKYFPVANSLAPARPLRSVCGFKQRLCAAEETAIG